MVSDFIITFVFCNLTCRGDVGGTYKKTLAKIQVR